MVQADGCSPCVAPADTRTVSGHALYFVTVFAPAFDLNSTSKGQKVKDTRPKAACSEEITVAVKG